MTRLGIAFSKIGLLLTIVTVNIIRSLLTIIRNNGITIVNHRTPLPSITYHYLLVSIPRKPTLIMPKMPNLRRFGRGTVVSLRLGLAVQPRSPRRWAVRPKLVMFGCP